MDKKTNNWQIKKLGEVCKTTSGGTPSRKNKNNENEDVAHPLNAETRKMFEDAVISEYEKEEDAE